MLTLSSSIEVRCVWLIFQLSLNLPSFAFFNIFSGILGFLPFHKKSVIQALTLWDIAVHTFDVL